MIYPWSSWWSFTKPGSNDKIINRDAVRGVIKCITHKSFMFYQCASEWHFTERSGERRRNGNAISYRDKQAVIALIIHVPLIASPLLVRLCQVTLYTASLLFNKLHVGSTQTDVPVNWLNIWPRSTPADLRAKDQSESESSQPTTV